MSGEFLAFEELFFHSHCFKIKTENEELKFLFHENHVLLLAADEKFVYDLENVSLKSFFLFTARDQQRKS